MNTAWDTYHRRTRVVHDVIERLDRSPDGELPWADVPNAVEEFVDPGELLSTLEERWSIALGTRIDAVLELGDFDAADGLADDVGRVWLQLAAEQPGLRRVLHCHADHPMLRHAVVEEHQFLAVSAGMASFDTPVRAAAAIGERLIASWRRPPPTPLNGQRRPQHDELPHWRAHDRMRFLGAGATNWQ